MSNSPIPLGTFIRGRTEADACRKNRAGADKLLLCTAIYQTTGALWSGTESRRTNPAIISACPKATHIVALEQAWDKLWDRWERTEFRWYRSRECWIDQDPKPTPTPNNSNIGSITTPLEGPSLLRYANEGRWARIRSDGQRTNGFFVDSASFPLYLISFLEQRPSDQLTQRYVAYRLGHIVDSSWIRCPEGLELLNAARFYLASVQGDDTRAFRSRAGMRRHLILPLL